MSGSRRIKRLNERLKESLVSARSDKREANDSGDDIGAAYAAGKESALITAIEIVNDSGNHTTGEDSDQ